MRLKVITLIGTLLLVPLISFARPKVVENIYPKVCKEGVHKQPAGEFAVYVFCDDALGTNIAVMHLHPGDSEFPKWTIDQRFWQGAPWSKDVSAIGWVPNKKFLVVATSEIYGEGSIFLLDLVNQTAIVLLKPEDCGANISSISNTSVTVGLNNCQDEKPYKSIVLKFPENVPESHGLK